MPEEIKQLAFKDYARKFIMGFQLISSLALGIFIIAVLYFALKYLDVPLYTQEEVTEAQKIGDWEFPDGNYILKNFENMPLENKSTSAIEIKDKKSGNKIMIFGVSLSEEELLRIKDNIKNKLLEKYDLEDFYLKSGEKKTGKYGEEISYKVVGWNSGSSAKTGIIGSLNCLKNQKIGNVLIVFVANVASKYDEARALEFINTLDCPASGGNGNDGGEISDKLDTDNDGLSDKVEKMLKSDQFKADTDGDGYNDFEELKNGASPMIPRPWDKYEPEEFEKVKKDIKYVNEDIYRKLFGGN